MHNRLTGTLSKKMASRADVNNWVKESLERFLTVGSPSTENVEPEPVMIDLLDPTTHEAAFVPTRGDEKYMFKARNESIREIHSRMLDCIEDYESAVRDDMEKNRS